MNEQTLKRPAGKTKSVIAEPSKGNRKPIKRPRPKYFSVWPCEQKVPLRYGVYQYDQILYLNGSLRYNDLNSMILVSVGIKHRLLGHIDNICLICPSRQHGEIEQLLHRYFPERDWQYLGENYSVPIDVELN